MQGIILIVMGVMLLTNILFGLGRSFGRSALRFGTTLVAFLLAFLLAGALAHTLSDGLTGLLQTSLESSPETQSLFEENPSFAEAIEILVQVGSAPLIFCVSYFVLKPVTWIVYAIVAAFVFPKKKKKDDGEQEGEGDAPEQEEKPRGKTALGRLGGVGMGVLIALLGITAFLTPVLGYTNLVGEVAETQEEGSEIRVMYDEALQPVTETPVASGLYSIAGKGMFNRLTAAKWHEKDFSLSHEIGAALTMLDAFETLAANPDVSKYGQPECDAVHLLASGISDSMLFSTVGSEILNHASNAWLAGEPYLGMPSPITGENLNADIMMMGVLRIFSTSNADNLGEDLDAIADIFELLVRHDMFAMMGEEAEEGDFVRKLAEADVIDETLQLVQEHPRLEPLTTSLIDAGIRTFIENVALPENLKEEFPELMEDISTTLQNVVEPDGTINKESLKTEMKEVIAEHNLPVEEAATELIAEGLAQEFTAEELTTLSVEEIADRLVERFGQVEGLEHLIDQIPQE